jgi:hypothetical protein
MTLRRLSMAEPYASTPFSIRDDLTAAQARAWARIARLGVEGSE